MGLHLISGADPEAAQGMIPLLIIGRKSKGGQRSSCAATWIWWFNEATWLFSEGDKRMVSMLNYVENSTVANKRDIDK